MEITASHTRPKPLQHTIIEYDLLRLAGGAGVDLECVLQQRQGKRCDRDRRPRDAKRAAPRFSKAQRL